METKGKKLFKFQSRSREGQAAVEYLLTLSVVFIGMMGLSVLFWSQIKGYSSLLLTMIQLPF